MGVTDIPADLHAATKVASHGHGTVRIGHYVAQDPALAGPIADLLQRARFDASVDADARIGLWEKVAFNAALNAMATITGLRVGEMDKPAGRRIAAAVTEEVVATAAAKGIGLDPGRIAAKIDFALRHHREHQASMLQDRLAGRRTEIEAINGQVVREAAALGVPAPVVATLADLVRLGEPGD
jgi:2-dehydropantoate 2-reductase